MPKRPSAAACSESPSTVSSASESTPSSTRSPARKRPRIRSSTAGSSPDESDTHHKVLKVYIVQEKLDDKTIRELFNAIEQHTDPSGLLALQLCSVVQDADIIITAIRMRRRLQRHVNWNVAVSDTNRILHVEIAGLKHICTETKAHRDARLASRVRERGQASPMRQFRSASRITQRDC